MEDGIFIGEVCRQANCTPRTVRHYETKGLIAPIATTSGGQKLYGKDAVSIICTAHILKRLGNSLKDIRQILNLTKSKNTRHRRLTNKLRNLLSDMISNMDDEVKLMSASREKIADLLEQTGVCEKCASQDCSDCGKLTRLRTLGLLE